jgi:ATP-dependent DNA ligase
LTYGHHLCGDDAGISDFARLHSRAHDGAVFLYAFDLLAVDGADIRGERLDERRVKLSRVLARPDGIRFSEHLARDGARVFEHACMLGLAGIVCKRRDAPYRSGRSRAWVKVKNPESAAMRRRVRIHRGDAGLAGALSNCSPAARTAAHRRSCRRTGSSVICFIIMLNGC